MDDLYLLKTYKIAIVVSKKRKRCADSYSYCPKTIDCNRGKIALPGGIDSIEAYILSNIDLVQNLLRRWRCELSREYQEYGCFDELCHYLFACSFPRSAGVIV